MASEAELCGCEFDCAVEEAGIRETLLFKVYSDQGDEFWNGMCMSCSKGKVGQRDSGGVCALWMSRVWK
jgi:hypothetical protein